MAPDSAVPDWKDEVPYQEIDDSLAPGSHPRVRNRKLYH